MDPNRLPGNPVVSCGGIETQWSSCMVFPKYSRLPNLRYYNIWDQGIGTVVSLYCVLKHSGLPVWHCYFVASLLFDSVGAAGGHSVLWPLFGRTTFGKNGVSFNVVE